MWNEKIGFELSGRVFLKGVEANTHMPFRNFEDYGSSIADIHEMYNGDDVIFDSDLFEMKRHVYKLNNRSIYVRGNSFLENMKC